MKVGDRVYIAERNEIIAGHIAAADADCVAVKNDFGVQRICLRSEVCESEPEAYRRLAAYFRDYANGSWVDDDELERHNKLAAMCETLAKVKSE